MSLRHCEHCHSEVEPVMIICPECGTRLQQPREESDWREQVRETVERHRHKRRIEQARRDDDARQLTIFPELSNEDDEGRVARARRAEIRARVEERLRQRSGRSRYPGLTEMRAPRTAAAAALQHEAVDEERFEAKTAEFDPLSRIPVEPELDLPLREGEPANPLDPLKEERQRDEEPFIALGLSSPGERILGGLIDLAFVALIQVTLFYLTTHLVSQRLGSLPSTALGAMGIVGTVLAAGYFLFFWSLSGQTLGKLLTGSRVVDRHGRALGFGRAGMRLLGSLLSMLPLGAGFLGIWTDSERRGWHDRLAGSKVVRG